MRTLWLTILLAFVAIGVCIAAESKIDIYRFAWMHPKWTGPLWYVQLDSNSEMGVGGDLKVVVHRNEEIKDETRLFVLLLQRRGDAYKPFSEYEFGLGKEGITFYGLRGKWCLREKLTVDRISTVGQTRTVVCTILKGTKEIKDSCTFGLVGSPKDLYTIQWKFNDFGRIGLVFSFAYKNPVGLGISGNNFTFGG